MGKGCTVKGRGAFFLPWKKIRNMTNQMMHLPTDFGSSFLQQSGNWMALCNEPCAYSRLVDEIPPFDGSNPYCTEWFRTSFTFLGHECHCLQLTRVEHTVHTQPSGDISNRIQHQDLVNYCFSFGGVFQDQAQLGPRDVQFEAKAKVTRGNFWK